MHTNAVCLFPAVAQCKSSVSVCTPWWPRLAAPHFFFFLFFWHIRWRRRVALVGGGGGEPVVLSGVAFLTRLTPRWRTGCQAWTHQPHHHQHPPRLIQLNTHLMYLWHYTVFHFHVSFYKCSVTFNLFWLKLSCSKLSKLHRSAHMYLNVFSVVFHTCTRAMLILCPFVLGACFTCCWNLPDKKTFKE